MSSGYAIVELDAVLTDLEASREQLGAARAKINELVHERDRLLGQLDERVAMRDRRACVEIICDRCTERVSVFALDAHENGEAAAIVAQLAVALGWRVDTGTLGVTDLCYACSNKEQAR